MNMSKEAAASREMKHTAIMSDMRRLENAVEGLACLVSEIEGGPIGTEKSVAPPATFSTMPLATFLEEAGPQISTLTDAVVNNTDRIRSLIF